MMAGLMKGKRGLVMGVANERSIAWGIARACADAGAELAFSYQGEALKKRVEPLAAEVGATEVIECDVVLVAVGMRPNGAGLGLEQVGVTVEKGFVPSDPLGRTNVPGIYSIGDVSGNPMLAHKATKEGEVVAEIIAGHKAAMDVRTIPAVVFTDPEIASAGLTDEEAKAKGHEVKVGKFPFMANSRAKTNRDTEGFVKVVADSHTGQVLGIHMIGHDINDFLGEATMISLLEAATIEVGFAVHVHPSLDEALKEAALAADGEAIHIAHRKGTRAAPQQGVGTR